MTKKEEYSRMTSYRFQVKSRQCFAIFKWITRTYLQHRAKRPLRAPTKETLVLIAVDTGGKNTQEYLSSPHSRSRDQYRVGGHPREVRWTVIPSSGKDSDSSDSRKIFIILIF